MVSSISLVLRSNWSFHLFRASSSKVSPRVSSTRLASDICPAAFLILFNSDWLNNVRSCFVNSKPASDTSFRITLISLWIISKRCNTLPSSLPASFNAFKFSALLSLLALASASPKSICETCNFTKFSIVLPIPLALNCSLKSIPNWSATSSAESMGSFSKRSLAFSRSWSNALSKFW